MRRPPAVIRLTPDKVAYICAWHGVLEKEAADEWALACGYDLNHTICDRCLAKFNLEEGGAGMVEDDRAEVEGETRPINDDDIAKMNAWLNGHF